MPSHETFMATWTCMMEMKMCMTSTHVSIDSVSAAPSPRHVDACHRCILTSNCFSRALRFAFLPFVLARRARASDNISFSSSSYRVHTEHRSRNITYQHEPTRRLHAQPARSMHTSYNGRNNVFLPYHASFRFAVTRVMRCVMNCVM